MVLRSNEKQSLDKPFAIFQSEFKIFSYWISKSAADSCNARLVSLQMVPPGEDFIEHCQQRSQDIDVNYFNAWTVKEQIFTYLPFFFFKITREVRLLCRDRNLVVNKN